MTTEISLEGLLTPGGNEERAIADVNVAIDGQTYPWKVYIPQNVILGDYLESVKEQIKNVILQKEEQWANLDPKTKTFTNPLTNEVQEVPIDKSEIVKPDIPDYYALRRSEYPSLGDQIGAIWKGTSSKEF